MFTMPRILLFILFIIGVMFPCIFNSTETDLKAGDHCFCKLKGVIDDCSCNIDTVDYFNNMKVFPRIQSLLLKDYFRFYKVNLKKECPFWSDDSRCAIRFCHVEQCPEDIIPPGLKYYHFKEDFQDEESYDKYLKNSQSSGCNHDHDNELGYLNTTISADAYKEFALWKAYDDAQDNFCGSQNNEDEGAEYVDLLLNPERYTGYKGDSAHRIWHTIYMENCFRPKNTYSTYAYIHSSKLNGMCLEKRAFYRVISGIHASINIHLCSKYLMSEKSKLDAIVIPEGSWGPNLQEFQSRFDPKTTDGEGPQWLKNLYFVYLLELRALAKAAPYLEKEEYYTGNSEDDKEVRQAVKDLLSVIKSFPDHFNESSMFNGGRHANKLKEEFRQHFVNISRIMDCVGCDKCKLWGKLQTHGLGTALNVLFSKKFESRGFSSHHPKDKFQLHRNEIVALINGFGRLSTSISELERFREMMR